MNAIFYFSGTGNSRSVAKRMAEGLGGAALCELTRERLDAARSAPPLRCETAVVVFPSYAYGLPALVGEFFRADPLRADYLALAVTCGTSAGGSLAAAKRILRRRKVRSDLYWEIPSVENFLPLFGEQGDAVVERRVALEQEATDAFLAAVRRREKSSLCAFRPGSATVSALFRLATPLLAARIRVGEACNGCELCRRACPANAIRMEDGRPRIDRRRCNQCQACLNLCPRRALSMWRHKTGCRQYLHPGVTVADLLKRD